MKINKVLLIRSSHYSDVGQVVKSNTLTDRIFNANYAELGLPLLAASTPPGVVVEMVDDCLDVTPDVTDADVVGISAMVIHLHRAIDLARHFKKQGKVVIMGGFLPTLHPGLVEDEVDAICVGEGDHVWPEMIADIEKGKLKKRYTANHKQILNNLPVPRFDLIKRNRVTLYPVMATRGCIHKCNYCSVICFFYNSFRTRPVEDVIRDIKAHGSRLMYFVDDNLMDAVPYAKELFRKMKGLKVKWGLQASPAVARDPELLKLAYEAGCRKMAIGFESVKQGNLDAVSKEWATAEQYKHAIRTIQRAGIAVHALIMFGLPEDSPDVFHSTVTFLNESGVSGVDFFILTPYPFTPLGKEYLEKGLIVDTDISHYREPNVVFRHPVMSASQIQNGLWSAFEEFYSIRNILRRVISRDMPDKLFALYSNLYYRRKVKKKIIPTHNQRGDYKIPFK